MMKKFLLIGLIVVLFANLLVGCESSQSTDTNKLTQEQDMSDDIKTDSEGSDDELVIIEVFHYMLQNTKKAGLDAVEAAYTSKNPNVIFENTFYNQGTDYFPQLSTALASGEMPNIIMGNAGLYPDVISEGYAMDLTDNEVINSLNLADGDLGDVSLKGVVYGFPIDFKSWGVFYNVDIFNDLGLSVPKTQSQLMDVCQKIADAGIDPWIHSYADGVMGDIEMRNTVWSRAVENGDYDLFENLMSGKKKFVDYPYFLEGLKVWQQRMQWHRGDAMANDQNKALELFVAGEGAMLYTGTWNVGDLVAKGGEDFNFDFFVAPIDENPGSAKLNVQVDQTFMVNPKAENADVALDFMEFWMTDGAIEWSKNSLMPLCSGQVSDDLPNILKNLASIKASGNIAHYGDFTMPLNTEFTTKWRQGLNEFAESCLTGGSMTPEECIANLQAYFDDVIATSY